MYLSLFNLEKIKKESIYKIDSNWYIEVILIFVDDFFLLGNNL